MTYADLEWSDGASYRRLGFEAISDKDPVRFWLDPSLESIVNHFGSHGFRSYQNLADTSTRKRLIRAIEISTFLGQNPEKEILLETNLATVYNPLVFGLNPPAEIRRERISLRLDYRLKNGLIEEVESLLKSGISAENLIYYGLEYKYVTQYLTGVL
eukprot:gene38238-47211_t